LWSARLSGCREIIMTHTDTGRRHRLLHTPGFYGKNRADKQFISRCTNSELDAHSSVRMSSSSTHSTPFVYMITVCYLKIIDERVEYKVRSLAYKILTTAVNLTTISAQLDLMQNLLFICCYSVVFITNHKPFSSFW